MPIADAVEQFLLALRAAGVTGDMHLRLERSDWARLAAEVPQANHSHSVLSFGAQLVVEPNA